VHTGPMYSDADTAALYDRLNPWGPSDDFYLSFVMEAPSALDVGCGTGRLLHRAREAGHTGRLCGVDPDVAALERARRRAGIEWVEARAADMAWDREFALAVMASNVFQELVTDQDLAASLAATRTGQPLRVDRGRPRFLDVEGIDAMNDPRASGSARPWPRPRRPGAAATGAWCCWRWAVSGSDLSCSPTGW
jgi:SAM-dependent methyltransferase